MGWKVLLKLNNRIGPILHVQKTLYKKTRTWNASKVWHVSQQLTTDPNETKLKDNRQSNAAYAISLESKSLWISLHNVEWFKGKDISKENSSLWNNSDSKLSEVWKERKQGSWIWIEDAAGEQLENLNNLEKVLNDGPKTFATCFWMKKFFSKVSTKHKCSQDQSTVWTNAYQVIHRLKIGSKGKWLSAEEVCGFANKRKWSINEDQITNLKVYCSKSKSED